MLILHYKLCLFLLFTNILALYYLYKAKKQYTKSNDKQNKISEYLSTIITTANFIRYGNLTARLEKQENKNLNDVSECINRMIETLNDREKMIVEYQTELHKKNTFLEAVINSLSDGLLIIDEDYRIIQTTNNINKWFGHKDKKLLNYDVSKFIKVASEKSINDLSNDQIFIEHSPNLAFRATTTKLDIEEHHNKYLIIIKDITTQKEIETLKEDFVATLTHDLKVPIVAESNMLNFLISEKFGEITPKQKEAIFNMQKSNKELLDLVQIVLETYKIKDDGVDIYKEPTDLSDLLLEVTSEMKPIGEANGNNLKLEIKDSLNLDIDKLQFKRVIKNLIQNAISHGQSNSDIEITMFKKDNFAIITVKDYGKGISKDDIGKIFNKYYSAAKKFRKIGTGLGLYLSKEIIKSHNGTLTVQSEEGNFTEFCISIPV